MRVRARATRPGGERRGGSPLDHGMEVGAGQAAPRCNLHFKRPFNVSTADCRETALPGRRAESGGAVRLPALWVVETTGGAGGP